MTPPDGTGWLDLLDALEERNRRCETALRDGGPLPAAVHLAADGPLPTGLRLRAELLLHQTRRLEELAARRVEHARLAAHYRH